MSGLPVDGLPVTCSTKTRNWSELCGSLLGRVPPANYLKGARVKTKWLRDNFSVVPDNVNEFTLIQYARAYILMLVGGCLFSDVSGTWMYLAFLPLLDNFCEIRTYSWGGAALAYLYRQLCGASVRGAKEMAGPVILLQLWAYEHITFTSPEIRRIIPTVEWHSLPLGYR